MASSASALLADQVNKLLRFNSRTQTIINNFLQQGAGVIDCAIAVLLHPSQAARLAAAWSLQSMAVAVPSHLTLLIDKYLINFDYLL